MLTGNLALFCGVMAVPAERFQGLHHLIWYTKRCSTICNYCLAQPSSLSPPAGKAAISKSHMAL